MNRILRILALLIAVAALAAPASRADEAGIRVDQAWARATPGAVKSGAIYLTITNPGAAPDELTGVSTPVADKSMIHVMKMANGVMEMRPLPSLAIPPGKSVLLDPSSDYHVMLTGLKAPLKEGQTLPLTLTFAHAGQRDVTVTVAKVGAMHPGEMKDMPGMTR